MQVRFLPGASYPIRGPKGATRRPCYGPAVLVSESTLQDAPSVSSPPESASLGSAPEPWTLRMFMRRHPWWSTGIGITLLSAVIVFVARTRPGFDPYGWLVWGRQTLSLSLDTNAAPSWKPLPYLFTVPYALAGHYQLRLWMITAVRGRAGGRRVRGANHVSVGRSAARAALGGDRRRRVRRRSRCWGSRTIRTTSSARSRTR